MYKDRQVKRQGDQLLFFKVSEDSSDVLTELFFLCVVSDMSFALPRCVKFPTISFVECINGNQ